MVVENKRDQQPPLGNLLKQLVNELNDLVYQHINLFRSEIKEDSEIVAKYSIVAFIGTLLVFPGLIFFGFFIMFTLSIILPLWLSSLIVTALYSVFAIISFLIIRIQINKIKKRPEGIVHETKKTMEDAKKWLHQLK